MERNHFKTHPSLLETPPHPACRATVIIPARNEQQALPATLEALRLQTDSHGSPLHPASYEVIVLLNNCTDASVATVRAFQDRYPAFTLHLSERTLPPDEAHVGTARRLLMDTAFHRLEHRPHSAILSTDADTSVAPDWIYRNLRALAAGADVVGGIIHLKTEDIAQLDPGTLHAYRLDRRYQRNVAHLESLLDADPADPWPRHLEHFGASLACTPAVYRRAGGLPAIKPLEDVAFIDALRRIGARIRHAPGVSVVTSARLHGRADGGLSGQLRCWKEDSAAGRPHLVQSAAYLAHRFNSLAQLRRLSALARLPPLAHFPHCWHQPLSDFHPQHLPQTDFLAAIDCNRLIDETFHGPRDGHIQRVIADLDRAIILASAPALARPAETAPAASTAQYATPVG